MTPSRPIRVAVVGLGPIGCEVVKAVLAHPGLRLCAAADPAFVGRDVGEVAGLAPSGVAVAATTAAALDAGADADVALVLTTSGVAEMVPIIDAAAARRVHVVSTCEDLAYADLATPDLAREIDARARAAGIAVLGTGVNPGFVMDRLPLTLAAACVRVDAVRVDRVVDAAKRRVPLREKVGAGLTVGQFEAGVASRQLGHRGLPESCALLGLGLGIPLDDIRSTIAPVVTSAASPRAGIEPGRVAGLRQSAIGYRAGREVARLDLEMSIAAPDPHDRIIIDGDPPLDVLIRNGTHGDRGTIGTVMSAIPVVIAAKPGLRTVLDLPLI